MAINLFDYFSGSNSSPLDVLFVSSENMLFKPNVMITLSKYPVENSAFISLLNGDDFQRSDPFSIAGGVTITQLSLNDRAKLIPLLENSK
jgi:hypothetical protein